MMLLTANNTAIQRSKLKFWDVIRYSLKPQYINLLHNVSMNEDYDSNNNNDDDENIIEKNNKRSSFQHDEYTEISERKRDSSSSYLLFLTLFTANLNIIVTLISLFVVICAIFYPNFTIVKSTTAITSSSASTTTNWFVGYSLRPHVAKYYVISICQC